jgi:hypothetical protein
VIAEAAELAEESAAAKVAAIAEAAGPAGKLEEEVASRRRARHFGAAEAVEAVAAAGPARHIAQGLASSVFPDAAEAVGSAGKLEEEVASRRQARHFGAAEAAGPARHIVQGLASSTFAGAAEAAGSLAGPLTVVANAETAGLAESLYVDYEDLASMKLAETVGIARSARHIS